MRPRLDSLTLAGLLLAVLVSTSATASPIKSDEEVLFFRTGAATATTGAAQRLPVRGWVFEPERDSWRRRMLLRALVKALGLPPGSDADALFRTRASMFLVDSESRKDVLVRVGGATYPLPRSGSSGLVEAVLEGPVRAPAAAEDPTFLRYKAVLPAGDDRDFEGRILLTPPEGVVVVSDIDDTVKVTVVKDRQEMLRNTFLRPFQAVEGMVAAYRAWAGTGAVFHYLSGSPVQLYPSLVQFLDGEGFPPGGVHLRSFWSRTPGVEVPGVEVTGAELLEASDEHKLATLESLLELHPQRELVLVGDSGEHDPEIYGTIARRHPTRIRRILIRRAPLADESPERYREAFRELPATLWSVFTEPDLPARP